MPLSFITFQLLAVLIVSGISLSECKADDKAETLSVKHPVTKRMLGELNRQEKKILFFTNAERKKHNKPELTAVSHLNVVAQRHAIAMARKKEMKHILNGESVGDRLKNVEYQFRAYGENIAANYPTEKATVQGWMDSPGHRQNLLDELNRGFTQIGIGAHRASNGGWYYCQVFARPAKDKNYE